MVMSRDQNRGQNNNINIGNNFLKWWNISSIWDNPDESKFHS